MAKESWGRWGSQDERGALNLIGPEQTLAATRLVKSGEALELSQLISARMPTPKARLKSVADMGLSFFDGRALRRGSCQFGAASAAA